MVGGVWDGRSRVVGGGCVWCWSCVWVLCVCFGCFLLWCTAEKRGWCWWLLCLFVCGYVSYVHLRDRFPHPQKKPTPLSLRFPPTGRGNRTPAWFPSRQRGNLTEGANCELYTHEWCKGSHSAHQQETVSLTRTDALCDDEPPCRSGSRKRRRNC